MSKDLDSEENTRFRTGRRTKCMKCWNPATADPLSSNLEEKMVLVESGLFIETTYSHSEQRSWSRRTQLLLWNWKIATKLEPLRILSKKIQETLLRMK